MNTRAGLPVVTVAKERKYSASHRLPWHFGKCHNLHGHTFVLRVSITGPVQPVVKMQSDSGMVVDFSLLGAWLTDLDLVLDHHHLNESLDGYPTAERLVLRLAFLAKRDLEPLLPEGAWVSRLQFCEEFVFPSASVEVFFGGRGGAPEPEQPPVAELEEDVREDLGKVFYQEYRGAKGGRTREGALMAEWGEMAPEFQQAFREAAVVARDGKDAAECYAVYFARRNGVTWNGQAAPDWDGLPDRHAWSMATLALRP